MPDARALTWMIETGVFPRTAPRVIAALERRGIPWVPYADARAAPALPEDARVIFWGSLGAAYEQRVAARWRPGAVGDPARFACSAYRPHLAHLGLLLANADAVVTTVADLVDAPARVLAPLGAPARVFVRPDSALKPFAGRVLAVEGLTRAALDHGFYYDDDRLPIMASAEKHVAREWRFVVADGVVVTGCAYEASRVGTGTDIPPAVERVAADVAANPWQPAAMYIVDVGEVDGAPRVLELNPFSGADLYDCDVDAIITAATRVVDALA